jgi:hypothetical protein
MNKFFKLLFFVGILFAKIQTVSAQVTYTAISSGDPTTLSNWDDGGGGNPLDFAQGDYFIIPTGITLTLNSGTWTLTDGLGTGGLGLQIDAGGTLIVNGSANVSVPPVHYFTLDGNYTHNSTAIIDPDLLNATNAGNTLSAGSNFTIGANQTWSAAAPAFIFGNLILTGTTVVNSRKKITLDGSLTIASGAKLLMNNALLDGTGSGGVGFTGQIGTGTFETTSVSASPFPSSTSWAGTVVFSSASGQTLPQGNYTNINASGGNRTFINIGTISISGTFTPGSGTYTTTSSTVSFNASGAQTIPALTSSNYNNLTIANTGTKVMSASLTIDGTLSISNAAGLLDINGTTLTLNGSTSLSGNLKGSSTSNLTIGGAGGSSPTIRFNSAATDSLLNTLTINRTGGGAGVTLGTNMAITNIVAVTNGDLNLNGKIVTLKSTSITNTAQVATVGGTITYNSGSFTVERFIPTPHRAYRDIAPGVNTYSGTNFFQTWQENGASTSGYGTHITGLSGASPGGVDASTGLDLTQTGAASLYNNIVGNWSSITNTKSTKPDVYAGYRVLIRGDRNVNLYQIPTPSTMNVATTLRASGQLVTGTVTYTTSGVSGSLSSSYALNPTTNGYSFLANPYVAALDWSLLSRTNISSSYTVFDPTVGTTGAYVTCNTSGVNSNPSSNVNQYIQPGQAFFVETSASSPQLVIAESNKATASTLTSVFRTNTVINKMSFGLIKSVNNVGNVNMDGCVAVFDAAQTNALNDADASKVANGSDNISVFRLTKDISIESRSLPSLSDTIPIRLWSLTNNGTYTISVNTQNFSSSFQPYILDTYANTERMVKSTDTTNITFIANTGISATFAERFKIVFRSSNALPIAGLTLHADVKNGQVNINWQSVNEVQLKNYEVENSTDASNFNLLTTVAAKNQQSNNYSTIDVAAKKGIWYYRLKIINIDGTFKYSNIVAVNLNLKGENLVIYPNPVKGNSFTLQLSNIAKGKYDISLLDKSGQKVLTRNFILENNNNSTSILVDWRQQIIAAGIYSVVVTNEDGYKAVKTIFIEK